MSLKKLLGIITVVIIVVFSMMLATSYAWYSFESTSTVFEGVTNNDDIIVSYKTGEYINTSVGVPINASDWNKLAESYKFSIDVKEKSKDFELVVNLSLVDVVIDSALQKTSLRVCLYAIDDEICIAGNSIGTGGKTTVELLTVELDNEITNNFELRVGLINDGSDQSSMMGKTFQAKVQVNVVSRLKTSLKDWSGADINISSITIDGEESDYIPVSGYYDMTATCSKGSNLTWEPISKTITYNSGSYVNDNCSLTFTTSDEPDYPLLSEMPVGSYVKYTGSNGCSGKACEGQNANYVSDTDTGYCNSSNYKFYVNGWRIGYVDDEGSAYLISGGAPECVKTYVDDYSTTTSSQTLSTAYYYGSDYEFDSSTGTYSLTGVTSSTLAWSSNYSSIISSTPYTCKSTSSTGMCTIMYKIVSYSSSTKGNAYIYYIYEQTYGAPVHLANLNNQALKYCNSEYSKDGVCNSSTAWAMDADDFKEITGSTLSSSSCYAEYSNMSCGYANDLIDNGSYYWIATPYDSSSSALVFAWNSNYRRVNDYGSNYARGVRPVLYLESSVYVTGGTGTYTDPYTIGIG